MTHLTDGLSVKGSWIRPKSWKHFSFYNVIRYDASVEIDAIGYRMLQGHRIVLNISCSYWPMIWTPRRCTNISFRKAHLSLPIIHNLEKAEDTVCHVTLQKWEVYAWWNDLVKRFKICHILYMRKPKVAFFISCYFLLYPNKCPGLCWHRPGHSLGKNKVAQNKKWKK